MKRALRLMEMVELLRDRPRTVEELAERFGVTERTIRRDLDELRSEPSYMPLVNRRVITMDRI